MSANGVGGDIRDGRGHASHRQLLKDIENANVLTGGCVCRSLPHSRSCDGALFRWFAACSGAPSQRWRVHLIHKASSTVLLGLGYTASLQRSSSNGSGSKDHQQQGARKRVNSAGDIERVAESAGDIRDGREDASHRQLLKDIENANVLTGGCVFRSLPHYTVHATEQMIRRNVRQNTEPFFNSIEG